MSLTLPPWYFAHCATSMAGTPAAATPGVSFTAGANNADGTAASVLAAVGNDVHYLVIGISNVNASTGNGQALLDVLIDPAGGTSWSSLIDDLVCGMTAASNSVTAAMGLWYHFPIWVKSGASFGVQARTRHTADITSGRVTMYAFGQPSRPDMWWCGQKVESLGINAATSQGTDVTPGNSGADGSWTTIGTSTGRYGALQFGINGSDATAAANGYHFQVGAGSQQLPGTPTIYRAMGTTEAGKHEGSVMPIWCDVPSGTTLQMRGTCSGTAEIFNCAVYGVY